MKNIKKYLLNGIILCLVSFLMRTVGVSFNVYVSNRAGAEAMGLYALLSGIYGFAITFATSGINLATMRLVSGALGKGDKKEASAALRRCITYSLIFSAVATLWLFIFAEFIGIRMLKDERTVLSLRILSLTLIPISLSSTFNGYFTAVRRVYKNAVIQVAEQAIKIASVSVLLSFFLKKGVEFACAALAFGGGISETLSFVISFITFSIDKRKNLLSSDKKVDYKPVTKELLRTALPIASSAYIRSGLISLEHMFIPIGLQKFGASKSLALSLYGIIQSMVLPIVLFPSAIISSFSGLLVPELTECAVKNNKRQIKYICERGIQIALIFSIGVSGIIICYSYSLGSVIYPKESTSLYIKLLAPLIPIMYIDTTVDHMLKGLGEQFYSMLVNIGDSFLSVILVCLLIPKIGIYGYIVTIYTSELINATFSIVRLIKKSDVRPKIIKWILKPLLCIVGATCLCHMLFKGLPLTSVAPALRLVIYIVITALIYLTLILATYAFDKDDVKWLQSILRIDRSIKSDTRYDLADN